MGPEHINIIIKAIDQVDIRGLKGLTENDY